MELPELHQVALLPAGAQDLHDALAATTCHHHEKVTGMHHESPAQQVTRDLAMTRAIIVVGGMAAQFLSCFFNESGFEATTVPCTGDIVGHVKELAGKGKSVFHIIVDETKDREGFAEFKRCAKEGYNPAVQPTTPIDAIHDVVVKPPVTPDAVGSVDLDYMLGYLRFSLLKSILGGENIPDDLKGKLF